MTPLNTLPPYTVTKTVASPEDFVRLRLVSGLTPRTLEAARKGLPHSLYGLHICLGDETVGMGRVVGDGALNFEVVDVAVDPAHQGKGIGRLIMQHVMAYLEKEAPESAYITLMADVPALYEKFGFELTRPQCEGMSIQK